MGDILPFPELASDSSSLLKEAVSKESLTESAEVVFKSVGEGEIDALDTYMKAKIGIEYLGIIMNGVKDEAITDSAKYGKDERLMYGCKFEVANGTTKYDYSHDTEWAALKEKMDALKEKMKAREDLMKKALSFAGVVDDDGVEIPPAKVVGGSGEQLKISIPKKKT
jgi:hypothetical protein